MICPHCKGSIRSVIMVGKMYQTSRFTAKCNILDSKMAVLPLRICCPECDEVLENMDSSKVYETMERYVQLFKDEHAADNSRYRPR